MKYLIVKTKPAILAAESAKVKSPKEVEIERGLSEQEAFELYQKLEGYERAEKKADQMGLKYSKPKPKDNQSPSKD